MFFQPTRRPAPIAGFPPALWLGMLILAVLAWAVLAAATADARPAPSQPVTIYCQNDVHGWMYPDPQKVPWSRLASDLLSAFSAQPNAFYINAGDLVTGPPFPDEMKGKAEAGIWNLFWDEFKARGWQSRVMLALGNHDLDGALPTPDAFHGGILCANLYNAAGKCIYQPYRLITTTTGLKVAVVGLIMENLSTVVDQRSFQGLTVRPMLASLKDLIPRLGKPDLLILVVHADVEDIEKLAREIPPQWGVDLMVTGHNHLAWSQPRVINGIYLAQCGSYNQYLGIWKLSVQNRKLVSSHFTLKPLTPTALEAYEALVKEKVDEAMGPQIAELTTPLLRAKDEQGESSAGDLVADSFRWKTGTDIAFTNTSAVRGDLNENGDPHFALKPGLLKQMVPFGNHLVTTRITGAQLLTVLEGEAVTQRNQVSGLSYEFDSRRPAGQRIISVKVGGKPLDPAATYTLTCNDFCTTDTKVEKYLHLKPGLLQWTPTAFVDYQVMAEYAAALKTLSYPGEGRIRDLADTPEAK